MNNYPTVRTDDILVHPRDSDLIVATHGRSIWIADDISPLQQLTPEVMAQDVFLFTVRPAISYLNDQQHGQQVAGQRVFIGENAPRGTSIAYYLKSAASGEVEDRDRGLDGQGDSRARRDRQHAGINRVLWNLAPNPPANAQPATFGGGRGGQPQPVAPGTYVVKLTAGGKTLTGSVTVLEDRWLGER